MRQQYDTASINRLLTAIKTLEPAVHQEDHQPGFCNHESFADVCDIMRRAAECMAWANTIESEKPKYKRGICGDFEYIVMGCCRADVTLYNLKTGKQLDVQSCDDGQYKLMFCDFSFDETVAFADRTKTIRAMAYFMLTQRQDPSVVWGADPELENCDYKNWV